MKYLEGVSIDAIGRGNRRLLAPLRALYGERHAEYDETLTAWKAERQKARELKDPAKRAEALEALKAERPTHPGLVAIGCAVVGGIVLWPVLHGWHTVAVTGGLTAWLLAALAAGQKSPEKAPKLAAAEVPDEQHTGPSAEALRAAVLQRLLDWVGDRRGIHLAEVYERYRQLPGHGHLADAQIRAALVDHYAVPVRPAVRIGDKVARGIHRDDLQPLPSPEESAPVADQRNTAVTSTVAA